eukprot:g3888.t1
MQRKLSKREVLGERIKYRRDEKMMKHTSSVASIQSLQQQSNSSILKEFPRTTSLNDNMQQQTTIPAMNRAQSLTDNLLSLPPRMTPKTSMNAMIPSYHFRQLTGTITPGVTPKPLPEHHTPGAIQPKPLSEHASPVTGNSTQGRTLQNKMSFASLLSGGKIIRRQSSVMSQRTPIASESTQNMNTTSKMSRVHSFALPTYGQENTSGSQNTGSNMSRVHSFALPTYGKGNTPAGAKNPVTVYGQEMTTGKTPVRTMSFMEVRTPNPNMMEGVMTPNLTPHQKIIMQTPLRPFQTPLYANRSTSYTQQGLTPAAAVTTSTDTRNDEPTQKSGPFPSFFSMGQDMVRHGNQNAKRMGTFPSRQSLHRGISLGSMTQKQFKNTQYTTLATPMSNRTRYAADLYATNNLQQYHQPNHSVSNGLTRLGSIANGLIGSRPRSTSTSVAEITRKDSIDSHPESTFNDKPLTTRENIINQLHLRRLVKNRMKVPAKNPGGQKESLDHNAFIKKKWIEDEKIQKQKEKERTLLDGLERTERVTVANFYNKYRKKFSNYRHQNPQIEYKGIPTKRIDSGTVIYRSKAKTYYARLPSWIKGRPPPPGNGFLKESTARRAIKASLGVYRVNLSPEKIRWICTGAQIYTRDKSKLIFAYKAIPYEFHNENTALNALKRLAKAFQKVQGDSKESLEKKSTTVVPDLDISQREGEEEKSISTEIPPPAKRAKRTSSRHNFEKPKYGKQLPTEPVSGMQSSFIAPSASVSPKSHSENSNTPVASYKKLISL